MKDRQFRVDYGLDLSRSLLAVPYRAKDVPSIRAEFGHPDVAVALTCLTYYYQGLDDTQLRFCFNMIYKLDNPPLEYKGWVNGDHNVPLHLQTLNGITTDNGDQFKNVVAPLFYKRKTVIDFYLSQVVFPKAAKEFPHKLSTSGWDLAESKPVLNPWTIIRSRYIRSPGSYFPPLYYAGLLFHLSFLLMIICTNSIVILI
ncbi:hypothetical protein PM082_010823 [Marasmius tenuissimus]|nr:hypothetical protein PM082_010823 [Marasmius tenuissimus]